MMSRLRPATVAPGDDRTGQSGHHSENAEPTRHGPNLVGPQDVTTMRDDERGE